MSTLRCKLLVLFSVSQCTLYSYSCQHVLYSIQWTVQNVQRTEDNSLLSALIIFKKKNYRLQSIVNSVQYTVYIIQSTVYSVQNTKTVYSVH